MANDYMTTTEIAKFNDSDLDGALNDILDESPLVAVAAARSITGIDFKYNTRTGAPVVGFRSANDGREVDKTDHTLVTATCTILDTSFDMDMAVAKADDRGMSVAIATETQSHLRAGMFALEQQIVNGGGSGFTGFADHADLDALADAMVIGAGGTGSDTHSVYAVRFGPEDTELIWGEGGLIDIGDPVTIEKAGATTGFYPAIYVPSTSWTGLKKGRSKSVGRIANLESAGSSNILTDDLLAQLIALFPAGRKPTHLVMNGTAQQKLREGRTATNPTGTPAPFPTDAFGIPIVVTDALVDTETAII